jgi:hypothetical protein
MTFKVPKSAAVKPENRFEFMFPGSSKKWSVPLLQFIPPKVALRLPDIDENDVSSVLGLLRDLFQEVAPGDDLIGQFDDQQQLMVWFEAWQNESTVSLGESGASATS